MRRLAVLLALAILPATLRAQGDDKAQVIAVVKKFFDGMRLRDTALIRSVVDSNATLSGPSQRNGVTMVRAMPVKGFMGAIASSQGAAWDERIYNPEVRVSDYLATLWAEYDFYTGTTFHHCGVDAFQLAKSASGWKIFQIADTQKETGCPKR